MLNPLKIIHKNDKDFPPLLREINDPPDKLYVRGNLDPLFTDPRILCVVGARKYSNYGKEVTEKLIAGLKGYNVCIVSGLALGIDSIAHRAALEAGIYTVAFPGSGLDDSVMYPRSHLDLSREIIERGGALLSEFEPLQKSDIWTFPSRNRLMAGISHATLVIEAELKSGSLITSKYSTDYNRDVGTVPGPIFSPLSAGPHMLMRNGATPVTCTDDLLELLGFARREGQSSLCFDDARTASLGINEKKIINMLQRGPCGRDRLIRELGIDTREANTIISVMELDGYIKEGGGVVRVV